MVRDDRTLVLALLDRLCTNMAGVYGKSVNTITCKISPIRENKKLFNVGTTKTNNIGT